MTLFVVVLAQSVLTEILSLGKEKRWTISYVCVSQDVFENGSRRLYIHMVTVKAHNHSGPFLRQVIGRKRLTAVLYNRLEFSRIGVANYAFVPDPRAMYAFQHSSKKYIGFKLMNIAKIYEIMHRLSSQTRIFLSIGYAHSKVRIERVEVQLRLRFFLFTVYMQKIVFARP